MPPKKRLSRMCAAIDAMTPLGFSSETVQAAVRSLLKVYGGDENWRFIEGDAYLVLIEAILTDEEIEESSYGENLLEANEDGADTAILCTRRGRYARPLDPPPSPVGSLIIGSGNRNEQVNPAKVLKKAPVKSAHKKTIQSESPSMNGWLIEDADVNDIKPMKRSHLKRKHPGC